MKVKITLKRSLIGQTPKARETVRSLGLKKINSSTEREINPMIQGMLNKVEHLVDIEEIKYMKKLRLHHLKPTPGSTKQKLRKGRGEAGKRGKTAGRGTKGTGARKTVPAYFEGGQIPLYRRIPKVRGIGNAAKMSYVVVNVSELEEKSLEGDVTPDILREMGLTRKKGLVKILGDGEITKKINLKVHAISEVAKGKIESAGGSVEIIKE